MASVLVVDDDEHVRDLLMSFLQEQGHDAHGAENGARGLILARSLRPRVVLLDIVMPGMSGIATLKELRRQMPETDVIMISGNSDHDTALKALEMGAVDFVEKPFDMDYLRRILTVKLALSTPE